MNKPINIPLLSTSHSHLRAMPETSIPIRKDLILLPGWLIHYQGANSAQIFFHLDPLAEIVAQLVDLGVCCMVLDWENPLSQSHKSSELPFHLKQYDLDKQALFVIDTNHRDHFLRTTDWTLILEFAQSHLKHARRLHVHDATNGLVREHFNFRDGHLIDGLLLPQDQGQEHQPNEQVLEALYDYLDMLHQTIRTKRIVELKEENSAKLQAIKHATNSSSTASDLVEQSNANFENRSPSGA